MVCARWESHEVSVAESDFDKESHFWGDKPAAYDRQLHRVVVTPPPADMTLMSMWRGRIFYALAEAAIHRDLRVAAPPWLRVGLCTCMDAAGRTGEGASAGHPALIAALEAKTAPMGHKSLKTLLRLNDAAFILAESPDMQIQAWGYTHMMIFGKGSVPNIYRRWIRALEKAGKKVPKFDLKKYKRTKSDLKKHVAKLWGQ